ncbi:hypothetical protein ACFWAT_26100 [Streptomyces syringium]|uniref:hypothetical protein n=1 Tax=Streptomyces syringium TaxID=76729 RepID=UPI00364DE23A
MLRRIAKRADVDAHPNDAIGELTKKLPATYQPTIRPLVKYQSELFGVPEATFSSRESEAYTRNMYQTGDEAVASEVFTFGSLLIIVNACEATRAKRSRNENGELVTTEEKWSYLTVTYAIPSIEDPDVSEFEGFLSEVWPGIELKEPREPNRRLRQIDNGKPNTTKAPTEEELLAAEALSEKSVRMLAIAIKAASGLLLGDASKQIPSKERSRIDELVQKLIDKGLVDTEVVIICTKTSAQINRVPSRDAFKQLDEAGLRCACGRALSAEKHEKALSITDFGRLMLDGSRWLSVLVLQHLLNCGIPVASIRMEQVYSGEEVDCIAEIYGSIVLFELKDKEFNRGNAYSFGAKIGIFQPDIPVVVTTEKVGADARDHFLARSANPGRNVRRAYTDADGESVTFIEGLDNLKSGLEAVVAEIAKSALTPRLRTALAFANPGPFALLSAWAGEGRQTLTPIRVEDSD